MVIVNLQLYSSINFTSIIVNCKHYLFSCSVRARERGSIVYCTTGIVLQWLQGDPFLNSVSHLVLDEIHERDMQADFLVTIARDLLPRVSDE